YNGTLYLTVPETDQGTVTSVQGEAAGRPAIFTVNGTAYNNAHLRAAKPYYDDPKTNESLVIHKDPYGYIVAVSDVDVNGGNLYFGYNATDSTFQRSIVAELIGTTGAIQIASNIDRVRGNAVTTANVDAYATEVAAKNMIYSWTLGSSSLGTVANQVRILPAHDSPAAGLLPAVPGYTPGLAKSAFQRNNNLLGRVVEKTDDTSDVLDNNGQQILVFADNNTIYVDVENNRAYTGYSRLPGDITHINYAFAVMKSSSSNTAAVVFFSSERVATAVRDTFIVYDLAGSASSETEFIYAFIEQTNSKGDKEYVVRETFVNGERPDTPLIIDDTVYRTIMSDVRANPGGARDITDGGRGVYEIIETKDGVVTKVEKIRDLEPSVRPGGLPVGFERWEVINNTGTNIYTAQGTSWIITGETKFVVVDERVSGPQFRLYEGDVTLARQQGGSVSGVDVVIVPKGGPSSSPTDQRTAKEVLIFID
ncbi:MAG: hypothetical protein FWG32_04300, partial [Oscillospiraceae bacterium]|nr:hypothetical protein [Oscillospiraceae bacterium]